MLARLGRCPCLAVHGSSEKGCGLSPQTSLGQISLRCDTKLLVGRGKRSNVGAGQVVLPAGSGQVPLDSIQQLWQVDQYAQRPDLDPSSSEDGGVGKNGLS